MRPLSTRSLRIPRMDASSSYWNWAKSSARVAEPRSARKRCTARPERHAPRRHRLAEPLHLLAVRAERHAEHVGDHLLADALALELGHQPDEHLVGDVPERRTHAFDRGEPRDEHRRLPHDGVDQDLRVHARTRGKQQLHPLLLKQSAAAAQAAPRQGRRK